jgi:hypothetical protein
MENLRKIWNDTCLAAGIDSMSIGKAAMTAAMLLVHGNHEAFTHNTKLVADLLYIQQRYHINGSEIADSSFVEELKACVAELEGYEKKNGFLAIPQEYKKWFKEMYSIEF